MTKKAVLIGCNYPGTGSELRGCANDCLRSIEILTTRFGFATKDIEFLTDAKELPGRTLPTAANIRRYIAWLVSDAKPGDSLFFHYSGHGSHIRDTSGDEVDGQDEVICPCDYETGGFIPDDEIFETLVKPLPAGVKLFSLMDCCHSGTIFDLKYSYAYKSKSGKVDVTGKQECAANIVMISGCRDEQTSADAYIKGQYAGAMTTAFAQCLTDWFNVHKGLPKYNKMMELMYKYMKKNKYSQRPQINCSHELDLQTTIGL